MSLIFKSPDEKQKALDSIDTDPPPGVNIEEFNTQTEAKIDEIMNAPIDDSVAEPTADPQADPQEPAKVEEPKVETSAQQEPVSTPKTAADEELLMAQRKAAYLQQQLDSSQRQWESKFENFEKKLEALQTQPPKEEPKKTQTDSELIEVQTEINKLEQEMNNLDEYDEDFLKKIKRSNSLQLRLQTLNARKYQDLIKKQQSEIDRLTNTQRLERQQEEERNAEELQYKQMDSFKGGKDFPELNTQKSYKEMMTEYYDFSREVGSAYYNMPTNQVTDDQTEIAMQQYLSGSTVLKEAMRARGIKEPEELNKFVVLSEVDAIKRGYVLDKITGKWVQLKDPHGNPVNFPDHASAYNYLKMNNGEMTRKLIDTQKTTANEVLHAVTRRADPVELDSRSQRGDDIIEMSKDEASKILEKTDLETVVLRARKNFSDPLVTLYNKALKAVGDQPLEESDL
jgi:hypothetical protein